MSRLERHNTLRLLCTMEHENIIIAQQYMKGWVETDDQVHTQHERANECNAVIRLWFQHLIEKHWIQIKTMYRARSYDFNYIFVVEGGENILINFEIGAFFYNASRFEGKVSILTAIKTRESGHNLMSQLKTHLDHIKGEASFDAGGILLIPESLTSYEDDGRYYKNNVYYQLLMHYL
jgi:hypothetical protein